jgi:hypothetical protein
VTRPTAWNRAKRTYAADLRLRNALRDIADTVGGPAPDYMRLTLRRAATRLEVLAAAELARSKREGRGR